jgi:hypothetical protein
MGAQLFTVPFIGPNLTDDLMRVVNDGDPFAASQCFCEAVFYSLLLWLLTSKPE